MTKLQNNTTEDLEMAISDLAVQVEDLAYLLKSDLTQWNIVEAIENLSFELKRLNDREESKKGSV
jgi:hypothetical protein